MSLGVSVSLWHRGCMDGTLLGRVVTLLSRSGPLPCESAIYESTRLKLMFQRLSPRDAPCASSRESRKINV